MLAKMQKGHLKCALDYIAVGVAFFDRYNCSHACIFLAFQSGYEANLVTKTFIYVYNVWRIGKNMPKYFMDSF